jgi:hypothetical protein
MTDVMETSETAYHSGEEETMMARRMEVRKRNRLTEVSSSSS